MNKKTPTNPRGAGRKKVYIQPLQRLTAYATDEEIARIRATFGPREIVEVLLAERDDKAMNNEQTN